MDIGDRKVLKASNRMFKIVDERVDGFYYWETIRFYDNGAELEIRHTELNAASRDPTPEEIKFMNKLDGKQ